MGLRNERLSTLQGRDERAINWQQFPTVLLLRLTHVLNFLPPSPAAELIINERPASSFFCNDLLNWMKLKSKGRKSKLTSLSLSLSHSLSPRLDINKNSPIDYKSGVVVGSSACSTPTKDTLKQYDRAYSGPVVPPRGMGGLFGGSATGTLGPSHMNTLQSQHNHHHHHYSTPLNFRKGFSSRCTWKCTAILVIMLCVILLSIVVYMSGKKILDDPC